MLTNITIQNIVLIENLSIDFKKGLCVLSGETGSGKSILLDALGLSLGDRASSRLLRQGCKKAMAISTFDISQNVVCKKFLDKNCLEDEDNKNIVTLKRILLDNLTSKAFINDVPVGLNLLSQIGESLVEIHGQNEQKGLLNIAYHRYILDLFAKNEELAKLTSQKYYDWQNVQERLNELEAKKHENDREIDYLSHIIKELEEEDVKEGEEENLRERKIFLNSKEKITNLVNSSQKEFDDAIFKIMLTQKNLIKGQLLSDNLDQNSKEKFNKIIDVLDDISLKGDEVSDLMGNILHNLNGGFETLEEVEERLFAINNLCRKFNKKPTELIEFLQQSQEKLSLILNFQTISADLKEKQESLKQEYLSFAKKLSNARKEAAVKLSKKVEDELNYLKMPGVKFLSEVKNVSEENYSANGIDKIKFLAAINQNQNFDDISKVASGGELSRFMLALKVALLGVRSVPVLIFDEIDSGIGGAVANAVGERLKLLSSKLQVMVVTHHAQVAAKSNYHLKVAKINIDEKTNTIIDVLNNDSKQMEIARMLSGEDISDEALQVAKKLMFS